MLDPLSSRPAPRIDVDFTETSIVRPPSFALKRPSGFLVLVPAVRRFDTVDGPMLGSAP
jgi:hypothetical protein